MPKKRRVSFIVAMLAITALHAVPSYARDDWELWTELKWKKKLSSSLTLQGGTYGRFRRNFGEFYKAGGYISPSFKVTSWLKAEPGYLHEFSERPKSHDTVEEHRLFVNLTHQGHLGPFQMEDRNRMEFRHINGVDDWRYRNKPKVSIPLFHGLPWEVSPFVADEIFYGFRAGELNRNRFFAGLEKPLNKHLAVELYYMVESNKTGRDWAEFHVLGLSPTLTF